MPRAPITLRSLWRNGGLRLGSPLLAGVLAAACAELPSQPTVAVMPGPYKPFEVFQADDLGCRGYAQQQIGGEAQRGASDYYLQYRYNVGYEQCMYSKGNVVPGFARPSSMPPPPAGQPPAH